MVEPHTLIQPHVEQLVHVQFAPRIGKAHDDAIDPPVTDDARNVADGTDHAGD